MSDAICRTCSAQYSQFGDGYDGECPDCADRTFLKQEADVAGGAKSMRLNDHPDLPLQSVYADAQKEFVRDNSGQTYEVIFGTACHNGDLTGEDHMIVPVSRADIPRTDGIEL